MLERFIALLRVFTSLFSRAQEAPHRLPDAIGARHALRAEKPLAYHHPLEGAVFEALQGAASGLFVHWGVYGSGKTVAVRSACLRLQAAGRTVILLQGLNFSPLHPMSEWLRDGIGVPDCGEPLSNFFLKPATIVIDDFDSLMKPSRDALACLRELAEDSEASQNFNVLLVVTCWEHAVQLRGVGCALVRSPSRWTEPELAALFASLPRDLQIKWTDSERSDLLRLSALSGTPGFMSLLVHGDRYGKCPGRASILNLEWRKGTRALVEGSQDMGPGRFPDTSGVFHWEDISVCDR